MSNTKTMSTRPSRGELASLLSRLAEKKSQIEELLRQVEVALVHQKCPDKFSPLTESDGANPPAVKVEAKLPAEATTPRPARRSPLDQMKAVMEATSDLREASGNLSAARVAKVFGISLSQIAKWLGRTKQALSKTPDADSLQEALGFFERVARLRMITHSDGEFRKWLRTPHELLDHAPPLELLAKGEWQVMADYVEDILAGNPG